MAAPSEPVALPLLRRLWIYQAERFPLVKTAILLAAFTSASINVSALLAGRDLPPPGVYGAAWLVTLIVFFQMRACDEWKDLADDRTYRPERPIPRGLVSLRLILGIGLGLVPLALAAAGSIALGLVALLLVVWAWLALMTVEFFVPAWLKARPFLYLVSHMMIMPLLDLVATGAEWVPAAGQLPPGLWLFLLLSFINGCVIEIGRKLYAPEHERVGVETYTALLGVRLGTLAWVGCLLAAYATLLALGWILDSVVAIALVAGIGLALSVWGALRFLRRPTPGNQKAVDLLAGVWVFLCYLSAGYVPLLVAALR